MAKVKAKIKKKYKQLTDETIDRVVKNCDAEIDKLIKRYEQRLLAKEKHWQQENSCIRDQERMKYEPIINEREKEIQRLRKIINDQKAFFESVQDREYQLEETTKNAVQKFERGLVRIQQGISEMAGAQDAIENYNRKQIKIDAKLQIPEQ